MFYRNEKWRNGNWVIIPAINEGNGRIITDSIEKANKFNFYYSTIFSSEGNIPHIQGEISGEQFNIDIEIARRKIGTFGKNKFCRTIKFPWRNSKTVWGSHDPIIWATTRYNNE